MKHKDFLLKIIILGVVWYLFHMFAMRYSLYYVLDWFDVFMHLFGGFWVGLLGVYFLFLWERLPFYSAHKITTILVLLLFVFSAGTFWELIEVFGGMTNVLTDMWDTVFDLICDMLGGAAAIYLSKSKLWPEK